MSKLEKIVSKLQFYTIDYCLAKVEFIQVLNFKLGIQTKDNFDLNFEI